MVSVADNNDQDNFMTGNNTQGQNNQTQSGGVSAAPSSGPTSGGTTSQGQAGNTQAGAPTPAPTTQSGSGQSQPGTSGQNSGGAAAPYDPNKATKSGQFTNLNNYLQANNGYNAQGGGLGGQIANNLNNQSQGYQGQIQSGVQNFNTAANADRNQLNQNLLNQAVADPTQVANNQGQLAQFEQMRTGTYTGPTGLGDTSQLQNNINNYQQLAGQAGNESGRFNLLSQMFGGGNSNYNQGQQSLDNLLLQSNPSQLGQLKQVAGNAGALQGQLTNANNTANTQAQSYQQEAQNTNQAISSALGNQTPGNGAIGNEISSLNDAVTNTQAQRQNTYNNELSELQNNTLDPTTAAALGLTTGMNTYGANLAGDLTNNVGQVGLNDVATTADQAKLAALGTLSGQSDLANYVTPTGTPLAGPGTFNNANATQAVAAQQAAYQNALNNTNVAGDQLGVGSVISALQNPQSNTYNPSNGFGQYATGPYGLTQSQIQAAVAQANTINQQYGQGAYTYGGWQNPTISQAANGTNNNGLFPAITNAVSGT